ncbi:hypothetical protein GCM10010121_002760 [Streptomyces brasiliensis]|uniref:Uncharacterized protein n=1 Tax=Streptomyces brasiliensis TaxID=1954 RepID=A0A917NGF7_9ACTN|nr:hypothetical protein GCM10010121_002760 [Streptomyces brasiliensis]
MPDPSARVPVAGAVVITAPGPAPGGTGRLSPAGPTPDRFTVPEGEPGPTEAERAVAAEGARLLVALGDVRSDGLGLACVAGTDAEDALRRLGGDVGPGRGAGSGRSAVRRLAQPSEQGRQRGTVRARESGAACGEHLVGDAVTCRQDPLALGA